MLVRGHVQCLAAFCLCGGVPIDGACVLRKANVSSMSRRVAVSGLGESES